MAFCLPWWHQGLSSAPKTVIPSGCPVNSDGNVPCSPEALRAQAESRMQALELWPQDKKLPLDVYSLGRYVTSEVGSSATPEEQIAVIEAAVHKAQRRFQSPSKLLLTGKSGHAGFYGPIHTAGLTAPFGRWAATSKDPTARSLIAADLVLSGQVGNFSNSTSQYGLDILIRNGRDPYDFVENIANKDRAYWVGPLPGVNHFRTFLIRTLSRLEAATRGKALISQAKDWIRKGTPDWSGLSVCPRPIHVLPRTIGSGAFVGLGVGIGLGVGLARLGLIPFGLGGSRR
jgi:hypothetical protein